MIESSQSLSYRRAFERAHQERGAALRSLLGLFRAK